MTTVIVGAVGGGGRSQQQMARATTSGGRPTPFYSSRPRLIRILLIVILAVGCTREILLFWTTAVDDSSSSSRAVMVATAGNDVNNNNNLTITVNNNAAVSSTSSEHHNNADDEDRRPLPEWMENYFEWHRKQRLVLMNNKNNNESSSSVVQQQQQRYLVSRCLRKDGTCSGTAHRLKHLPVLLWLAYSSRRMLFIVWELPAALEHFLVPPPQAASDNDGNNNHTSLLPIDWRMPRWLQDELRLHDNPLTPINKDTLRILESNRTLVSLKYLFDYEFYNDHAASHARPRLRNNDTYSYTSSYNGEQEQQQQQQQEPTQKHDDVLREVWNRFFVPSPPVNTLLQHHMENMELQPNSYVAVHVRSLYFDNKINTNEQEIAINCAANVIINGTTNFNNNNNDDTSDDVVPIYFTSDSAETTRRARNYANNATTASSQPIHLVSRNTTTQHPPIHLDLGKNFLAKQANRLDTTLLRPPEDYYDVFVDLYLLAYSRCVVYGTGGFGHLGAMLSYNKSCSSSYKNCS